jgi:hypothetical protein
VGHLKVPTGRLFSIPFKLMLANIVPIVESVKSPSRVADVFSGPLTQWEHSQSRNSVFFSVFGLHVAAQPRRKSCGARKEPARQERIPRSSARLAATCKTSGVDGPSGRDERGQYVPLIHLGTSGAPRHSPGGSALSFLAPSDDERSRDPAPTVGLRAGLRLYGQFAVPESRIEPAVNSWRANIRTLRQDWSCPPLAFEREPRRG